MRDVPFSQNEMAEYVMDVINRVLPFCNKETVVLEIGIGSGMICEALCPYVNQYIGVDVSAKTLSLTEERLKKKGINNVRYIKGSAKDISNYNIPLINIVIINSVAQYFPGNNYFISVLNDSVKVMQKIGVLFIGDLMDYDKKKFWKRELELVGKKINQRDLWYSKGFIRSLVSYIDGIDKVEIYEKEGTIKNELTEYRFNALISVDKNKVAIVGKKKRFEEV